MSDWIEWGGGEECPVAAGTHIEVKFRDGTSSPDKEPELFLWQQTGRDCDIIAYRIVKPACEGEASSATIAPSDAAPAQVSAPSPHSTIMRGFAAQYSCALACIMVNEMKEDCI